MSKNKKDEREDMRNLWLVSAVIVVLLVIFMWATAAASQRTLSGGEERLFLYFYNWPYFLLPLALIITQLGSVWMLVAVTLAAWLAGKKRLALFTALTGAVTYAVVWMGKEMIARPRPEQLLANVTAKGPFEAGYGYPSAHTALATVLALLLWKHIPKRYRWLAVALVLCVAVSRMYLGQHFPLDVLGGFLVGAMIGGLLYLPHHKKVGKPKFLYRKIGI